MGSVAGKNRNPGEDECYRREAHHAGSWYDDDAVSLHRTLNGFLADASSSQEDNKTTDCLRAIIVPHAGYRFSGPTAAYSYLALQQALMTQNQNIKHILVLHPAHHVYLQGCAVSGASALETPVGNLPVDDKLRKEILALSSKFTTMTATMDEEEHSGEMQYPYLAKILLSKENKIKQISVLPIMCGALSTSQEAEFGRLLAPIVARPNVICVISSDFCHWGSRFRYQPTSTNNDIPIHEFIKEMDHQGMDLIELQQPGAFADYIKRTKNTICGRHAIAVWMQAITANNSNSSSDANKSKEKLTVKFVKYAQSSAVVSMRDSSVSYASAVVTKDPHRPNGTTSPQPLS